MALAPRARKLALTAHVTASVGWLGAVAVFLALAITGLTSQDAQTARSAYVAMDVTGWSVIVPLCFASLATGVISALGTTWGLLRYYWITVKLTLTVLATVALILHMPPISQIARAATDTGWSAGEFDALRTQLAIQSGAALLVLLVATALSVYKPQGKTRYGTRKQRQERSLARNAATQP